MATMANPTYKTTDSILSSPTLPEVPNRNGPIIYDVTMTPSLNGIDPYYKDKNGVQAGPTEAP